MTFDVRIETPALRSIQRNAFWWADHHSPDEAVAWENAIFHQIEELRTMPERHGLARENGEFSFELRQQLLGTGTKPTYRALFRIEGSTVHVLEFLAAEQDDVQPDDL